jgi:hypothetical protein
MCIFLEYFVEHFFNKEYTLISRRYQLHPAFATMQCPMVIRMHTAEKKEKLQKKIKPRYSEKEKEKPRFVEHNLHRRRNAFVPKSCVPTLQLSRSSSLIKL